MKHKNETDIGYVLSILVMSIFMHFATSLLGTYTFTIIMSC